MGSDGNEKRIRALFSELSLEDQMSVPQFGHVWSRSQVVAAKEVRSFRGPVAVLISVMVTAAACSFAVWTWYRMTASPVPEIVYRLPQVTPVVAPNAPAKLLAVSQRETLQPRRKKNIARRSQVDRHLVTEAALLSTWQSPTQAFMESPTSFTLSSLPQLNQSAKDLESFLPKNNEIMKESNR